jgi:hypothetical protein
MRHALALRLGQHQETRQRLHRLRQLLEVQQAKKELPKKTKEGVMPTTRTRS